MATVNVRKTSINDLPDEILQHILFYLSPVDILINVQPISKRFARLGNEPLLWRHHCRIGYKYWDPKHRITQKFAGNVGDVDWKKLYFYRKDVDMQTIAVLNGILASQIKRIEKYDQIGKFGYDAKDVLLRHCLTDEMAYDVLARRFYSNSVLDYVHRCKALEEWFKLSKGGSVPLERALGGFDMFVLHDQYGDLLEISEILDRLLFRLKEERPQLETSSSRCKALAVAQFLRAINLTGISSELQYRDLQNNYLGIALQAEDHPSLPLVSVAIFCALAQRLGLDARCCGFPHHVHAIVYPKAGESLDGPLPSAHSSAQEPMYLDPYRSDVEVPVEHLMNQLVAWGVHTVDFPRFLRDSSVRNIVLRTSRNILATVHEFRGIAGGTDNTGHPTIRLHANPFADLDNAFYSALWANFMLCGPPTTLEPVEQHQFIPMILERFERLFPMDVTLIERYVCPSSSNLITGDPWGLAETLRVVRAGDAMPKQIRIRDGFAQERVKYKVGQVFQHKRYGYTAVITGWDVECTMNSQWMAQNQVDRLSQGRHQSFYHALVEDTSIRYVAEENVEIIKPEIPVSLMSLAGRFFKRWDGENRRFESNIRDEYPDD